MARILIVDDEPSMRRILASNLRQEGYEVIEAAGLAAARAAIAEDPFDAVITDQKMGDGEGLEVLAAALEADSAVAVVFLTAFATVELAVESMRRGAFDFITKPFLPEVHARDCAPRGRAHAPDARERQAARGGGPARGFLRDLRPQRGESAPCASRSRASRRPTRRC